MAGTTKGQLARANKQAALCAAAMTAIEQAGRGLAVCAQSCDAHTPDMKTIGNLVVVQGYLTDALTHLLERERHKNPEDGSILIPGA